MIAALFSVQPAFGLSGTFSTQPNLKDESEIDTTGVASFNKGHCVAALLEMGGPDSAPAYVLTNGHCFRWMKTNEVVAGINKVFDVAFHGRTYQTNVLEYATMKHTDIGLYRLNGVTVGQFRRSGVRGYPLASEAPAENLSVTRIHAFHEVYSCRFEGLVHELREYKWIWRASLRHHCKSWFGSSGSPLIDERGRIVAVHNTRMTGHNHKKRCDFDNPCEVDEKGGIREVPGMGYAQQVYKMASCFGEGVFDLSLAQCQLDR